MKTLLILSILCEVFLLVLAFSPIFVDRQSAARAFVERRNNPTAETEATLQQGKATNARIRLTTEICVFGLIALNTWGMIVLIRRIRHASKLSAG
jgi:hypothetical protein